MRAKKGFKFGLALFLLSASCAEVEPLRVSPSSTLVPLVDGAEPGSAAGECVVFTERGPVTQACPPALVGAVGPTRKQKTKGRGIYQVGTFVAAGKLSTDGDLATSYELATFGSHQLGWRELSDQEREGLGQLCSVSAFHKMPVITKEFDGCGVVLTGALDEAEDWSIKALEKHGSIIGQPDKFWSLHDDVDEPSNSASCQASRVVLAEVITLAEVCRRYDLPLGFSMPTQSSEKSSSTAELEQESENEQDDASTKAHEEAPDGKTVPLEPSPEEAPKPETAAAVGAQSPPPADHQD